MNHPLVLRLCEFICTLISSWVASALAKTTMSEYICLFHKDTLILKPPKKSPLFLRTVVLLFAVVCGFYICTVCLKQISTTSKVKFQNILVIENSTPDSNIIELVEAQIPTLHYPKPETFSRGECTQNPVRFFAILSTQRSGSGWFETLLNSHINISSSGEIFSAMDRRKNISTIIQTLDKVYNLDWFNSASKNECSAAVGFKWMLNQGLTEHHKHGTHKSHVHSEEEAASLSRYKPIINSTSLLSDLKEAEMDAVKAITYFNSTRHMVLYYEDLIVNNTKLKDVQEFLGVPKMELTSRQVKIHKGLLSDLVKNWDDVVKTLNGTQYQSFLEADY